MKTAYFPSNEFKTQTRKNFFFIIIIFISLSSYFTGYSFSQPIQTIKIPSSINPVGSGARALGMGGAFIAVADDATAASWNPGGLVQLDLPEISIVGASFKRSEDNEFGNNPEASGEQNVSQVDLNYASFCYPFEFWGRNMIFSINYQHLYDFARDWDFVLNLRDTRLNLDRSISHSQNGALSAIGLAYGIQVTPRISLGLTLNIWNNNLSENKWEETTKERASGTHIGTPVTVEYVRRREYTFDGINANLGALWRLTNKLTIGAVIKTPFTADLEYKNQLDYSIRYPTDPGSDFHLHETIAEDQELEMPLSFGLGLAYRFFDNFTVSADIYRTEWQDFVIKDESGEEFSPITGQPISESSIDHTYQVRIGAEYLFIGQRYVVPLRGGCFYDPSPAPESSDDIFGISVGSGIGVRHFVFDIAYQYRFGRDIGEWKLEGFEFSQDLNEHTLLASVIVHF